MPGVGPTGSATRTVVDVHLSNLRRKLEQDNTDTRVIHTVRGVGFRLANDVLDAVEPVGV